MRVCQNCVRFRPMNFCTSFAVRAAARRVCIVEGMNEACELEPGNVGLSVTGESGGMKRVLRNTAQGL